MLLIIMPTDLMEALMHYISYNQSLGRYILTILAHIKEIITVQFAAMEFMILFIFRNFLLPYCITVLHSISS